MPCWSSLRMMNGDEPMREMRRLSRPVRWEIRLGVRVFSVEIIPELADHARAVLNEEGYGGVHVLAGNGYKGWPEHSPFNAIIVTCAPETVPRALVDQLREGGRMILPVGIGSKRLVLLKKTHNEMLQEDDIAVTFVPMVHEKQE